MPEAFFSPDAAPQADLSNWRRPPHSRWAFRHVESLIPVDRIPAARDARPSCSEAPAEEQAALHERFELPGGVDMPNFLEKTRTDALVVRHDGRIVYEFRDTGMLPRSRHILMSATKSVVGLVAGILASQGRWDLAAPVSRWVPEVEPTAYRAASLRQLLDMQSGVRLDAPALAAYAAATGWEPPGADGKPSSLHAFFSTLAVPFHPPGGAFSYVSANTDLLGWAMERATGQRFAALASELLWQPMGAEEDAAITLDAEGAPRCTGGMCATARDLAALGQLMLDGGVRDGRAIVPREWLADIAEGGDASAWQQGEFAAAFGGQDMHYRSGWYVLRQPPRTIFAMGIHGQNLFVDRAHGIAIAKLSSQAAAIDPAAIRLTQRAVAEFRRLLTGA